MQPLPSVVHFLHHRLIYRHLHPSTAIQPKILSLSGTWWISYFPFRVRAIIYFFSFPIWHRRWFSVPPHPPTSPPTLSRAISLRGGSVSFSGVIPSLFSDFFPLFFFFFFFFFFFLFIYFFKCVCNFSIYKFSSSLFIFFSFSIPSASSPSSSSPPSPPSSSCFRVCRLREREIETHQNK